MASELDLDFDEPFWITKKKKPKGHGSTLEEMWPDYAISTTKLSPLYVILKKKKNNKKLVKCGLLKIVIPFVFLTFWLSYCT